jgi:putative transposase
MKDTQSLSHVSWECKYHIVRVPKYRRKILYRNLRRRLGEILKDLCRQNGVELVEGHALVDHLLVCLSFPPKYCISEVTGFLKGKSAIRLHREFGQRNPSKHFWVRGYYVSTVGYDEQQVREYNPYSGRFLTTKQEGSCKGIPTEGDTKFSIRGLRKYHQLPRTQKG